MKREFIIYNPAPKELTRQLQMEQHGLTHSPFWAMPAGVGDQ